MAKPRVFVSSTFYDLKYVRNEIESFVRRFGYEAILNERGRIPYPKDRKLDESCYQEVANCDMLVAIVGGRWGSPSSGDPDISISQEELRRAHKQNKQVFIFVEKSVLVELQIFKQNKENREIKYPSVDNLKIFEFIEEVESYSRNNALASFESAEDITSYLREQWAGMMFEMLHAAGRGRDFELTQRLESTLNTLERVVKEVAAERSGKDSFLLAAHPIFSRLKTLLKVNYRVFFTTHSELNDWLAARQFTPVEEVDWDSADYEEWIHNIANEKDYQLLKVKRDIFDENGQLRIETIHSWEQDWATLSKHKRDDDSGTAEINDDDIPF